MDVHVGGEQVESLTEAEPDTPERDAPPTSSDDVPDAGKQAQNNESQVNPSVAMVTCSFQGSLTRLKMSSRCCRGSLRSLRGP